jgi:integrase/recombinase XerD
MDARVDAFLEMLLVERNAARNTLLSYTQDLTDFAEFAAGRSQSVSAADAATCQAYMASLHGRGLSARTAARRLSALRQFHLFLLRDGDRTDDPTSQLDTPKLPQKANLVEAAHWLGPRWKSFTSRACAFRNCCHCRGRHSSATARQ